MMNMYEMTNLGLLHHFLGMRILQTENGIFIGEKKYVLSLLGKCGLKSCKPLNTSLVTNDKLCKMMAVIQLMKEFTGKLWAVCYI